MEVVIVSKEELSSLAEEAATKAVAASKEHSIAGEGPGWDWITGAEAKQLLNLSKPTLQRYRANGTLPFAKLGQNVYYRLSDVARILESRLRTGTSSEAA